MSNAAPHFILEAIAVHSRRAKGAEDNEMGVIEKADIPARTATATAPAAPTLEDPEVLLAAVQDAEADDGPLGGLTAAEAGLDGGWW